MQRVAFWKEAEEEKVQQADGAEAVVRAGWLDRARLASGMLAAARLHGDGRIARLALMS